MVYLGLDVCGNHLLEVHLFIADQWELFFFLVSNLGYYSVAIRVVNGFHEVCRK